MSTSISSDAYSYPLFNKATKWWFAVVFIGQLFFAIYILFQYIITGVVGDVARWSESSTGGYVSGDGMGNFAFAVHVFLAGIITIGGPLQLLPQIRNRYREFHRINGRVYILAAYVISLFGLYLIWVRGTVGDTLAHSMTSINGLIIIVAATFTIREAMAKDFTSHERWAIRLFLAMSGVFFFRVLLYGWLILFQDTGIDFDSFTGPALDAIGFCAYIAPQIIAEWHFRSKSIIQQKVFTGFLVILILLFCIGTVGAAALMWWPTIN